MTAFNKTLFIKTGAQPMGQSIFTEPYNRYKIIKLVAGLACQIAQGFKRYKRQIQNSLDIEQRKMTVGMTLLVFSHS